MLSRPTVPIFFRAETRNTHIFCFWPNFKQTDTLTIECDVKKNGWCWSCVDFHVPC